MRLFCNEKNILCISCTENSANVLQARSTKHVSTVLTEENNSYLSATLQYAMLFENSFFAVVITTCDSEQKTGLTRSTHTYIREFDNRRSTRALHRVKSEKSVFLVSKYFSFFRVEIISVTTTNRIEMVYSEISLNQFFKLHRYVTAEKHDCDSKNWSTGKTHPLK